VECNLFAPAHLLIGGGGRRAVAIGSYLCLCVSMHEPHVKRLKAGHEEAANELVDMYTDGL